MRRTLTAIAIVGIFGAQAAFAVSDGQYSPAANHCTGDANNSDHPTRAEKDCKTSIVTLSDGTGHEYAGWGINQTADGDFAHAGELWLDPGQGTKYTWTFDGNDGSYDGPTESLSTAGDPSTGLHFYFGADDNLDGGEHDSSEKVSNGPSDGGAIQVNIDPSASSAWVTMLQNAEIAGLLSSPAPFANAGSGFCADGVCFAITTQRRVAFQGGARNKHRDIANYDGKAWDPITCDGPDDQPKDCSDSSGTHDLKYWANQEGTVYTEPGLQIYEDPDPQASPAVFDLIGLPMQDPFPIPALYIGSCGVIFGGGPIQVAPSPQTNSAGQLVIPTSCN